MPCRPSSDDCADDASVSANVQTAWGFYTVHIPLWFILFVYLYFFHSKYNQAQCAVEFPPIRTLHFVLAGLVFSWWLFGLFVYVCFTAVIFSKKKPKRDLLERYAGLASPPLRRKGVSN